MARKQHLSRLAAPSTWPIKRKGIKWIVKPSPGPHSLQRSIPLIVFMRDILKITKTATETKKVLARGLVKISGKPTRKEKFPIGLFDVIEIPVMKKYWRVLLNKKGKLDVCEISESEAKLVPVKVMSKKTINKGKIQLNLSNGWNLLDNKNYSVNDVLLLDTEKKSVAKHITLQEGALAYVIGGKHIGRTAKIKKIKETGILKKEKLAILEASPEESWQSPVKQIFVIGTKEPEIKLEQ